MARYWKLVVYVATAVIGGTGAALFDGHGITHAELANIAVLVITAISVYYATNSPTQPWAKTVTAVLGAAVTILTSAWTDRNISPAEWQQIILAVLGAIGVHAVANIPPGAGPQSAVTDPEIPTTIRGDDYPYSAGAAQ